MSIRIEENVAPQLTMAVGYQGAYNQIGPVFHKLGAKMAEHGVRPVGPMLAVFHDDPMSTPEAELRSHAAAPVTAVPEDPELETLPVTGGKYAIWRHVGGYEQLGAVWDEFTQAVNNAPYQTEYETRSCFEVYVRECGGAEDPVTDLYIPVV